MPKHKSYTVKFKLEAVNWYKNNGRSIRKTAMQYQIDRKRIREWIQRETELKCHSRGSDAKKFRISSGSDLISQEIEFGTLEFLNEDRERGLPVSNQDLKDKALEIARSLNQTERIRNFKASDGWLSKWKKRNRIAILRGTNEAQKVPEDYGELIKGFVEDIQRERRQNQYTMYNIGNMDQTMCRFDMAPKSTNNVQGERSVRIGTSGGTKRGFTVALCALANGYKKSAYIVLKERNGVIPPRALAQLRIPGNICVTATPNGWMTGPQMHRWVNRIWGNNVDDVRRLIILDKARIHTMQLTIDQLHQRDTDVVFIPGGCTPIAQPADVCWNAPFKSELRKEWRKWKTLGRLTPAGNAQAATRQDVINWVSNAWSRISAEVIKNSFKCCGITVALDGSEDGLLSDKMCDALNAADQYDEIQDEAAALLFDSDSDSEIDFEGFTPSDLESDLDD